MIPPRLNPLPKSLHREIPTVATDDCAIVVGVARYRDSANYPTLKGPINDVQHIVEWLEDPKRGAVPTANIRKLVTTQALLDLPDPPLQSPPPREWQPSRASIEEDIYSLVLDSAQRLIHRPNGRLYLYFSGHGFTSDKEDVRSAALFTADAGGAVPANFCGTLCAEALSKLGVFGQIVLIMDCCRDVKLTAPYDGLLITDATAPNANQVSVLEVYAAPKGGKAQEGVTEDGLTGGFMTHALLKSIAEVPPDIIGRISASALDNYMAMHWSDLVPTTTAPPKPRILQPPSDQAPIYFASGRTDLVDQEFSIAADVNPNLELYLQSFPTSDLPRIRGVLADDKVRWTGNTVDSQVDVELSAPDAQGRRRFTLRLIRVPHEVYALMPEATRLPFIPGNGRVNL